MIKIIATVLFLLLVGCASGRPDAPQDVFWANMQVHCGNAYAGRLIEAPPGDTMLTGTEELIVHFRECGEEEMKVPFHIEKEETDAWDRSRTWVFTRHAGSLELRHDHRHEDGSPEETTWYGGETQDQGSGQEQRFIYTEGDPSYDGPVRGWRLQTLPNERYTYGTFRGDEWRFRVDFDLSAPVPPPPAPWGHE